jgi:hypothetical protein
MATYQQFAASPAFWGNVGTTFNSGGTFFAYFHNDDGTWTLLRSAGNDFTFNAVGLTGGTITSIERLSATFTSLERIDQFSLAATAFTGMDKLPDILSDRDTVIGSAGNDDLRAFAGNDTLRGGFGADKLDGGADSDFASYGDSPFGITANLSNPASNTGPAFGDTYINIENLAGSSFPDTLIGDKQDFNFLQGRGGADVLIGGGGLNAASRDYADYFNSPVGLTVSLANPAANTGEAAGDFFVGMNAIRGSAHNDVLIGDDHDNTLRGGLGADILIGGGGEDGASYYNSDIGLIVNLVDPTENTGEAEGDTYVSIENLGGTAFDDTLVGDTNSNHLAGREGADHLVGGGGDDYTDYRFAQNEGVTVNLADSTKNAGAEAVGDTYVGIHNIRGSLFDDKLTGDGASNTVQFSENLSEYVVSEYGSRVKVTGPDGTDLLADIEHLKFADKVFDIKDDGNVSFDSLFYLSQNADVAAAGVDPLEHYNIFGWHEGRDPNPYFDTSAYLAANPDVAAAGVNPYEHYNTFGWQEGRNPGQHFDAAAYLATYHDVAAAHVNPLEHFLQFGANEGRVAFELV